jgi:hypothetical protein
MPDETLPIAAGVAMGLVLAACAGLRAFLPLLALGVAGRAGVLHLGLWDAREHEPVVGRNKRLL